MHEAYLPAPKPMLRLTLVTVESICALEDASDAADEANNRPRDFLLVGTKQGSLLMYAVSADAPSDGGPPAVQLFRMNKAFSKRPVTQLAAVADPVSIVVALTDACVQVNDVGASNLPAICTVPGTRGAGAFALDARPERTLTGQTVIVRLAVAVKRKLKLFYWKDRKFRDLQADVSLPDVPRSLAWCGDSVCVGFRGEYVLIKLGQQEQARKLTAVKVCLSKVLLRNLPSSTSCRFPP